MIPRPELPASEPAPRANLLLPWSIVVAPNRAFALIERCPEFIVPFAVVVLLTLAATALEFPALEHVLAVTPHPNKPPPAGRELAEQLVVDAAFIPFIGIFLQASALTLFAGTRDATRLGAYRTFVSLAAVCTIPATLGTLIGALAIRLHDPASFGNLQALEAALPVTFGAFASPANDRQVEFLAHFGPFDIWGNIVLAFGYARLANVGFTTALVVAFSLDLVLAFVIN